jgi:hypothetical protein
MICGRRDTDPRRRACVLSNCGRISPQKMEASND